MGNRTRRVGGPQTSCLLQFVIATNAILAGCASPGQPKPPSLRLPQVVGDLAAERVGGRVHLRWTTPSTTTDDLPVSTRMSAVVCRQAADAGPSRGACAEVKRLPVQPGPSTISDDLPPALSAGARRLLTYRVEILNAGGRSAGNSREAFAAAGLAPATVENLRAVPVRKGVRIEWTPGGGSARVELVRVDLNPPAEKGAGRARGPVPLGSARHPTEVHLAAGAVDGPDRKDSGGTVDRSVQTGATYRYTAERVETALLAGHKLEIRSDTSGPVTVKAEDTFAPSPPAGLEAAPGGGETPTVDLSWRPGAEADLVGYHVFRAELGPSGSPAGAWVRLDTSLVPVPAFEDRTVRVGVQYRYRVTAVDSTGNESAAGNEVQETPGTR